MSQKLLKLVVLAIATASLAPAAYAQSETASESSSKAKIEDVDGQKNKAPGEDVDETLTNKQMRAQSGSKSKWSIASQLSYYGGSVEKPMDSDRPNIGGAAGTTDVSQLNGQLSGKYAMDQRHSLLAGFGFRYISPFQGNQLPRKEVYSGNKVDAENPYVTWQYIYKAVGLQNVLQVTGTYYTNSNLVSDDKYVGGLGMSHTTVYEVGTTGLSLGLYASLQGNSFSTYLSGPKKTQNDYSFGIDPYLEYTINDMFNLRTVFNLWNYDHYRQVASATTFDHNNLIQSVGLGISVTRDIFLYPNLQFVLDDIRADRTNVAITSYINLF